MHTLSKTLRKISHNLVKDEQDIKDANECICNMECAFTGTCEALLKEYWVFHKQRLSLVSGCYAIQQRDFSGPKLRVANSGKINFKRSSSFYGDQYASYAAFISSLKKDSKLFAEILHKFSNSPPVFERLFSVLFCTITNFSLTENDSAFLNSVLQQLFHRAIYCGVINTHFLTDLRSSFHTRFFLEGLPDSRRYLSALLCELITEIHVGQLNCHGSSANSGDILPGLTKSSSNYSHCTENGALPRPQFVEVVNRLILSFQRTATFFPPSCLLWLHCLRKVLRSFGASDTCLRQSSTEHILSFITRALVNPQLILNSGPYLEPGEYTLLKAIASALNFLAQVDPSQTLSENVRVQVSVDTGIQATKLLEFCDVERLCASLNLINNNADRISLSSTSWLADSHVTKQTDIGENKLPDDILTEIIQYISMITPTDLNILVECLRIFLQHTNGGFDAVRGALLQLPLRVPESLIGVRSRLDLKTRTNPRLLDRGSLNSESYELVHYNSLSEDTKIKSSTSSLRITRSRSTSRLGLQRTSNPPTESRSAGRCASPITHEWSPLTMSDLKRFTEAERTVLIFRLNRTARRPSILSEDEFLARRPRNPVAESEFALHSDKVSTVKSSNPDEESIGRNHPVATSLCTEQRSTQSQSSSGLSRSSGDQMAVRATGGSTNLTDNENAHEHGNAAANSSPMRFSRPLRRDPTNMADEHRMLLGGSTEDLMAEDRSLNDPSSDASERSGFTSLASSAHAMRVRAVSGLRALSGHARGSGDSVCPGLAGVQAGISTAHGDEPHSCNLPAAPEGVGKRTRFSQPVLFDVRYSSETNGQIHPRERHSTEDSLEEVNESVHSSSNQMVDTDSLVFGRTHPVPRTCSVELVVRSSGPDSLPDTSRYGARSGTGTRHPYGETSRESDRSSHDGLMGVSLPTTIRCSSLGCLPAPQCASLSTSGMVRTSTGPDVNEVDERSSGVTCSSCGIRVSGTTDDAEQRDLVADDGSRGDGGSHEDGGQLSRRLDGEDHEAEEDALSDLPDLSSANVSGRVTPLSLTSSTSRGGTGGAGPPSINVAFSGESPGTRVRTYNRAGLIFPNGVTMSGSTATAVAAVSTSGGTRTGNSGSVRFGMLEFPASLLHTHESPDVTEKFGKFELPVTRLTEVEARSTVSDTWSTDVLPSDTEYPDGGSEYLGPEPSASGSSSNHQSTSGGGRAPSVERSHNSHHHRRHRRDHQHHCRDPLCSSHETRRTVPAMSASVNSASESVTRNPQHSSEAIIADAALMVDSSFRDSSTVPHRSTFFTPIQNGSTTPSLKQSISVNGSSIPYLQAASESVQNEQSPEAPTGTDDLAATPSQSSSFQIQSNTPNSMQANSTAFSRLTESFPAGFSRPKERTDRKIGRPHDCFLENPTAGPASSTCALNVTSFRRNEKNPTETKRTERTLTQSDATHGPSATGAHSSEQLAHAVHWRPNGDRADESVDEMMDRYRKQTEAKQHSHLANSHDRIARGVKNGPSVLTAQNSSVVASVRLEASTSSGSPNGLCSSCSYRAALSHSSAQLRIHLIRGLRRMFSSPLVGSVLNTIICQLMATEFSRTNGDYPANWSRQDVFFMALLDALVSDTLISQDPGLTTCIRETKRLLERLLLNTQVEASRDVGPGTSDQSHLIPWTLSTEGHPSHTTSFACSSVGQDSVVASLLTQLRIERRNRLAYLAYLKEQRNRALAQKHSLTMLQRRCERDLQAQCEYIVHKYVTAFLDSQREAFRRFYEQFTLLRNQSGMDDRDVRSTGQGVRSAASHLASQFIQDLIQRWEAIEPDRRPPILFPVSRLRTDEEEEIDSDFAHLASSHLLFARMHIRRLVMEKVYQSGVWMNDPALERERDLVLHRELALLKRVITLSELQVPERYHVFEPFHSVQDELRSFGCSHLPSDMLQCLKRVMERIVATLQLACPQSVPNADDLLPVLIFTVFQVNPPRLLTNMAFVDLFMDPLDGEDQYVWCQFGSAVAEIRRLLSAAPLDSE
ncbi:hypothetical protein D915_007216 [Fasciola hepatica]|uniref:VPS9 domain-containing protein n=1 Tax=Fasciola hepatica TaxID=6192 RepID=A0A4E0R168_FASHE|nr:hypothetical protein D915_007216 [Fasciola hepatica]